MLMSVKDLSKELSLSESGIYQMVSQKRIPHIKLGRTVRFDTDDIRKWLGKNKNETE
jgi:excisionase family DNA binding protein